MDGRSNKRQFFSPHPSRSSNFDQRQFYSRSDQQRGVAAVSQHGLRRIHFGVDRQSPAVQPSTIEQRSCWTVIHERVRAFSEETFMQGIGQMLSDELHWFTRIAWFLVFVAATLACVGLVGTSFERYFDFEVSTTTSLETLTEVNFPAITFCNENMLKKSMVQFSPVMVASLSSVIFGEIDDYAQGVNNAWLTCAKNVSDAMLGRPRYDYESFQNADEAAQYFRTMGMNKAMSMFALDSNASVLKCWWKDSAIDCSKLFLNHMTDYGWCFTMNPGVALLKGYRSLGLKPNATAYGVDKVTYRQLKLRSTGPYNGFKTLLHVHQDEYCVTRSHGAGFTILVHDADVQPLFFLERPISLSPGYETNVAVRYTKLTKNTEGLGRCANSVPLALYPHAVKYYKQACLMECFTDYVYDACNCTPLYGPPRSNYLKQELLNLSYTPRVCGNGDLIRCMKKRERQFLSHDIDELCVRCDPPCHDLHYDFQVSSTYFPAENTRLVYEKQYGKNKSDTNDENGAEFKVDYLRSNLVSANFFVESMQVHHITERQAFTLDELVGDAGAHIGFLLGLSVIGLFEMVQCCCLPRKSKHKRQKAVQRR